MNGILGFSEDEGDEVVEVHIACECGAVATFRRTSVDPPDEKLDCTHESKWRYRVVHGGKK